MLAGVVTRRVQRSSAERDFKNAEQVQRDQRDEGGEADEKNRIAKLHSPARVAPCRLDADDDSRQRKERKQNPERIDQTKFADAARLAFGLVDEAENF